MSPCTIDAADDSTMTRAHATDLPESLRPKDGDHWARSFDRIEEARAALAAEGYAMRSPAESYNREKWSKDGGRFVFCIIPAEVEHRDNYSMGEGNWVGFNRNSGWKVKSRTLPLGPSDECYAWEDAIPTAGTTPPAGSPSPTSAPTTGQGYTVEEHTHTKKGTRFAMVVLADRVDRERFENLRDSAKRAGGWYSRQWGSTPGGFAFDARGAAEVWAAATLGGGAPTPPDGGGEPTEAPKAYAVQADAHTGGRAAQGNRTTGDAVADRLLEMRQHL